MQDLGPTEGPTDSLDSLMGSVTIAGAVRRGVHEEEGQGAADPVHADTPPEPRVLERTLQARKEGGPGGQEARGANHRRGRRGEDGPGSPNVRVQEVRRDRGQGPEGRGGPVDPQRWGYNHDVAGRAAAGRGPWQGEQVRRPASARGNGRDPRFHGVRDQHSFTQRGPGFRGQGRQDYKCEACGFQPVLLYGGPRVPQPYPRPGSAAPDQEQGHAEESRAGSFHFI